MEGRKATRARKPTMTDVARLAGVSQSTVSLVVNGRAESLRISQETEERVRAAMQELGFRPNHTARSLRLQRTGTIGIVTDFIASSPHSGRMLLGAQDQAWKDGNLLLLVNTNGDQSVADAAVRTLIDRQVDALVYATMDWGPTDLPEHFTDIPSVLLNCWEHGALAPYGKTRIGPGRAARLSARGHPAIGPDELSGGRLAARTVVEAGHREVAYLAAQEGHPATVDRLAGFRQVMDEAGLPVREDWIICVDEGRIQAGYAGACRLLASEDRPTAIVCWNDEVAVGAIAAALFYDLRVPQDLSIVGYDDDVVLAPHFPPGLTTVCLPHYELGQLAVEALLEALRTGDRVVPPRPVAGRLVTRASVCPPPA